MSDPRPIWLQMEDAFWNNYEAMERRRKENGEPPPTVEDGKKLLNTVQDIAADKMLLKDVDRVSDTTLHKAAYGTKD